jgi:hypothetical protein
LYRYNRSKYASCSSDDQDELVEKEQESHYGVLHLPYF